MSGGGGGASPWAAAGVAGQALSQEEEEDQLNLGLRQEEKDQHHFRRMRTSFILGRGSFTLGSGRRGTRAG